MAYGNHDSRRIQPGYDLINIPSYDLVSVRGFFFYERTLFKLNFKMTTDLTNSERGSPRPAAACAAWALPQGLLVLDTGQEKCAPPLPPFWGGRPGAPGCRWGGARFPLFPLVAPLVVQ